MASASASASASAAASLSANASLAMRLNAAARLLGINLTGPGGPGQLNAAMSAALSIQPPGLPLGGLAGLLGQTSALSLSNSALGIDMLAKAAIAKLKAMLANILGNLNAAASATASAALSLSASAAATAAASFNASAVMSAAAQLNASLMARLPSLMSMSLSANLCADLSLITGVNPFASSPCSGCKMF